LDQGQGHGSKKVENSYYRSVKLQSTITPLYKTYSHEVCV